VITDLAYALRVFRRQAGSFTVAVLGLAVAIGVSTTAFSLFSAYYFRPLGVVDPAGVINVSRIAPAVPDRVPFADYVKLRSAARLATFEASVDVTVAVADSADAARGRPASVRFVSGTFADTFGARVRMGRALGPSDNLVGAAPVATIYHAFWQSALRADPAVVGRVIYLDGEPVTIVGVFDRAFSGPFQVDERPTMLLPLESARRVAPQSGTFDRTSPTPVRAIGRLNRPATVDQARAEIISIAAGLGWTSPATGMSRARSIHVSSGRSPITAADVVQWTMLIGIVGLVLLLASANVGSLLLAGAAMRQQEIGTRLALGATRARLARQFLTESLLLGGVAGGFGLVAAGLIAPMVLSAFGRPMEFAIDVPVTLFVTMASVLVGAAAGLAPARFGVRGDLAGAMRSGTSQAGFGAEVGRAQSRVLAFQAAVSMLLLVMAGMFLRGFAGASQSGTSFDTRGLLAISIPAATAGVTLSRVREMPGMIAAALVEHAPFDGVHHPLNSTLNGRRYPVMLNRASPEYFNVAGFRLTRGRTFTAAEIAMDAPVAVITETLASDFWPDAGALASTLERVDPRLKDVRVIGVAADTPPMYGSSRYWGAGMVYRPAAESSDTHPVSVIMRVADPSPTMRRAIQESVTGVDPLRRPRVRNLDDGLQALLEGPRILASASAAVGGFALMLAVVGVFSVTAFIVRQRQRELGIRIAIGARWHHVAQVVLRRGLRPVAIGLVGGTIAGLALVPLLPFFALGAPVHATDPLILGGAAAILAVSAGVGTLWPVHQASRLDPIRVLKE
jgi:predicted permease